MITQLVTKAMYEIFPYKILLCFSLWFIKVANNQRNNDYSGCYDFEYVVLVKKIYIFILFLFPQTTICSKDDNPLDIVIPEVPNSQMGQIENLTSERNNNNQFSTTSSYTNSLGFATIPSYGSLQYPNLSQHLTSFQNTQNLLTAQQLLFNSTAITTTLVHSDLLFSGGSNSLYNLNPFSSGPLFSGGSNLLFNSNLFGLNTGDNTIFIYLCVYIYYI
jgi:hypothetical protein